MELHIQNFEQGQNLAVELELTVDCKLQLGRPKQEQRGLGKKFHTMLSGVLHMLVLVEHHKKIPEELHNGYTDIALVAQLMVEQ